MKPIQFTKDMDTSYLADHLVTFIHEWATNVVELAVVRYSVANYSDDREALIFLPNNIDSNNYTDKDNYEYVKDGIEWGLAPSENLVSVNNIKFVKVTHKTYQRLIKLLFEQGEIDEYLITHLADIYNHTKQELNQYKMQEMN